MSANTYETRDFHGFRQTRRVSVVNGKRKYGFWKFHVTGFDGTSSGSNGYCTVLMSDESISRVPITKDDELVIYGRKFSRLHWEH